MCVFPQPPSPLDWDFVHFTIGHLQPIVLAFDVHPLFVLPNPMKQKLFSPFPAVWGWVANCCWYGAAQSRLRHLRITSHKFSVNTPVQVPILLGPIQLPKTIREYLQPLCVEDVLVGDVKVHETTLNHIREPLLLGCISPEKVSQDAVSLAPSENIVEFPMQKFGVALKISSVDGTSFPMGEHSSPAGFGHTLVYDPENVCVRRLSTLECWLLSGGSCSNFIGEDVSNSRLESIFLNFNPPEFCWFVLSLTFGISQHHLPGSDSHRVGSFSLNVYNPILAMPQREKMNRALDTQGRMTAISRALVYACRHGSETLGVELDSAGWAPLSHLLEKSETLARLRVNSTDVEEVIADPNATKLRLESAISADGQFSVRTFQCHSASSGVSVRTDPANKFIASPGYLLRGNTLGALRPNLNTGIRRMARNAIHMVPCAYNETQGNYVRRRKTPILQVIDANRAASQGKQSFFAAPNGVILSDGGEEGVIPPEFIVAVFVREFKQNSRPTLSRLYLDAAKAGRLPIPYYSGPNDSIPIPGSALSGNSTQEFHAIHQKNQLRSAKPR